MNLQPQTFNLKLSTSFMKPKYVGILVASFYIIFKMVLFFLGKQHEVLAGKALIVLLAVVLLGIFYVINNYVRTSDTYDWMAAFKRGLTVSLVASVIAGAFIFVYYKWIDLDYLSNLAVAEYNTLKAKIPADKMTEFNESLAQRYKPGSFFMVTVSLVNIAGLFSSLIVALLGRMTVRQK